MYLVNWGFLWVMGNVISGFFLSFFLCTIMPLIWISVFVYCFPLLVILGKICFRWMGNSEVIGNFSDAPL